jgi:hypothetical protein
MSVVVRERLVTSIQRALKVADGTPRVALLPKKIPQNPTPAALQLTVTDWSPDAFGLKSV